MLVNDLPDTKKVGIQRTFVCSRDGASQPRFYLNTHMIIVIIQVMNWIVSNLFVLQISGAARGSSAESEGSESSRWKRKQYGNSASILVFVRRKYDCNDLMQIPSDLSRSILEKPRELKTSAKKPEIS